MSNIDHKNNEDFSSLIRSKIENLRPKLLDLSRRNPLISTRFSTRSSGILRVVDELPGILYDDLASGESMRFVALPPLDDDPKDEHSRDFQRALSEAKLTDETYLAFLETIDQKISNHSEENYQAERALKDRVREDLGMPARQTKSDLSLSQHAKNNGISPSYELPEIDDEHEDGRHTDTDIQTLLLPDSLETRLSSLMTKCRTWMQETGINVLYVAFGFLEWTEKQTATTSYSPLILLPVEIERKKTQKGLEFSIRSTGDGAEINAVLAEKLRLDFGIEIPQLNGRTVEDYLREISELSPNSLGWKVRRQVALGAFPSTRMAMYYDLETDSGKYDSHDVIGELFGGTPVQSGGSPFGESYDVDAPEVEKKVPYLVCDADSSQFSTIVDVVDGKNLAVEGPPGSGKSQTIVNTIAAALADGKKVLFVAEKMAALDVVKSRLEAVGLGEFLLSLQASKSTKEQVITSLRDRVEMEVGAVGNSYDKQVANFRKAREEISTYIDLISLEFRNTGLTIFEILGKSISSNELFRSLPRSLQTLPLDDAQDYTPDKFEQIREYCDQVEEVWAEANGAPDYWKGTSIDDLDPFKTDDILSSASTASDLFYRLSNIDEELSVFGVSLDCELEQANLISDVSIDKLDSIASLDWPALIKLVNDGGLQKILTFFEECEDVRSRISDLEKDLFEPLDQSQPQKLRDLVGLAETISVSSISSDQIEVVRDQNRVARERYESVCDIVSPIAAARAECVKWKLNSVLIACDIVSATNLDTLMLRDQRLLDPAFKSILSNGIARIRELRERRAVLEQDICLDHLPPSSEILDHVTVLKSGGIFSFLSSDFRRSKRFFLSKVKSASFDRLKAVSILSTLATWATEKEELEKDPQLSALLGVRFKGLDSDFAGIAEVMDYYRRIDEELSGIENIDLRNFLKSAEADLVSSMQPAINGKAAAFELNCSYEDALETLAKIANQGAIFDETVSEIARLATILKDKSSVSLGELLGFADAIENILHDIEKISHNDDAKTILGEHFRSYKTDHSEISTELDIARSVVKLNLNNQIVVLDAIKEGSFPSLKKVIDNQIELRKTAEEALINLSRASAKDLKSFDQGSNDETASFLENAANDLEGLTIHSKLHSNTEKLRKQGYGEVLDALILSEDGLSKLRSVMDALIARSLTKSVYSTHGSVLANYDGSRLNELRRRIAIIDKDLIKLSKQHLRHSIHSSSYPPVGIGSGRKSTWTELSLIYNEINKSRRYVPVRDLTRRAGKALLELKPCWMMSPLAVAQYIQQGALNFDLVIIDEASQMTPENAVGAILRSKRAMIVGDTNQLPPSNFFNKVFDDQDADEDEVVSDESILEMANSSFRPARRLRWHYRSKHSGLIAFSNRHIYDDDLVIFPSASETEMEHMGVKFVPVQGRYSAGTNIDEAKVMVDHIVKFMQQSRHRSLGVVTLNQKQRELIEDEIRLAYREHAHVSRYMDEWEEKNDGLEAFFVKNLENVQGDERDVIFIGTVYGPEKIGGPVMQRFGPINGVAGKRRLNVLFSRAKEQIVTFSSMTSANITADENGNPGAYMLKQWLEYAATGVLHAGDQTYREPDSDFEIHVIEQLKSIGCIPVPQVGVAGYFIDIGVKHPDWPHGFVLGVECDGAAYHSSKSARDRDRLRQEVLEGLGWRFHRIWSTDWFSNSRSEVYKLRNVIENRLAELKSKENEFKKVTEFVEEEPHSESEETQDRADRVPDNVDATRLGDLFEQLLDRPAANEDVLSSKSAIAIKATAPPTKLEEEGAKVGDKVLVKYLEGTQSELEITLSDTENVPSKKIVHVDEPLGEAVFGALEGEEIEVWIGGEERKAQIKKITVCH